jgi:TPR repeat protein
MNTTNILPRRPETFARFSTSPHRAAWISALSLGAIAGSASLLDTAEPPMTTHMSAEPASSVPSLEQSCKTGNAVACNDLGVSRLNGYGMPVDTVLAFQAFERSCGDGSPDGCSNLGALYERGIGVENSLELAVELYERACTGGAALGCSNLGALYARGRGVERDPEEAQRLFRLACESGSAMGCSNLSKRSER